MGPISDLGPIDPQVFVPDHGYVSAKEIMSAVDRALMDVSERPDSYPLHSALLGMGNVDATLYEFASPRLVAPGRLLSRRSPAIQILTAPPPKGWYRRSLTG
jgi:hypothetical protein